MLPEGDRLMKVAIPVFRGRVAPVFDWCLRAIVLEIDAQGRETSRSDLNLAGVVPFRRPEHFASLRIETLLCGGISSLLHDLMEKQGGVRVIPWVAGDVNEILSAFVEGRLSSRQFMMPGCCCTRGRWRLGHGFGRRGRWTR